jgi:hypothetical protein
MSRTNFSCNKSTSAFILCCSASYAALSGLPEDGMGAGTGTGTGALGAGAELSWAVSPLDFLVPLAAGLAFGPDIAVNGAKKSKSVVFVVRIKSTRENDRQSLVQHSPFYNWMTPDQLKYNSLI